jgi:uncharacterized protein (TIGR02996 family)
MTDEEKDFRESLTRRPDDVTTRMVYADWLEEHDRPKEAKFLRTIRKDKFLRWMAAWSAGRGWDPFTGHRPSLEDYKSGFAAYRAANPMWGNLHIVLEDGNVDTESVAYCMSLCAERDDELGQLLAMILLSLTPT